jgi:hypothetical protein
MGGRNLGRISAYIDLSLPNPTIQPPIPIPVHSEDETAEDKMEKSHPSRGECRPREGNPANLQFRHRPGKPTEASNMPRKG